MASTKKPTNVAQPARMQVNPVVDIDEKEFDLLGMEDDGQQDPEQIPLEQPSGQSELQPPASKVRVSLRIVPCLN